MSNSELDPTAKDNSLEPNLDSMCGSDMMELVMKDGRIATRVMSSNAHMARDRDGFQSNKARHDKHPQRFEMLQKIRAEFPIPNFDSIGGSSALNVLKHDQDPGTNDNKRLSSFKKFSHLLKPVPHPFLQNSAGASGSNDAELIRTAPVAIIPESVVASSSLCSHGASNDPTYYQKRKYQDDDDQSPYLSETSEEDYEDCVKEVPTPVNTNRGKKRRTAEMHNLSERKRRDKINKKMRVLQELIPNSNKVDKAAMLDEAIEYLKTLQIQAQIMSMGCMPQMMLPTGFQRMYAPAHLPHFSPFSTGMGMRMDQLQFQTQSRPTSMSGIPGTGYHLLGIPMSLPHPNFIPSTSGPFAQSVPLGSVSGSSSTSSMVEHPTSCSEY